MPVPAAGFLTEPNEPDPVPAYLVYPLPEAFEAVYRDGHPEEDTGVVGEITETVRNGGIWTTPDSWEGGEVSSRVGRVAEERFAFELTLRRLNVYGPVYVDAFAVV